MLSVVLLNIVLMRVVMLSVIAPARLLVTDSHFHPSLIFASKAGAYPSEAQKVFFQNKENKKNFRIMELNLGRLQPCSCLIKVKLKRPLHFINKAAHQNC